MKHKITLIVRLSLLSACVVAAILAGCATPRTPIYRSESFNTASVDEITILSVVDARPDQARKRRWDKILPKPTQSTLRGKGYKVRLALDPTLVASITQEAIEKGDPGWIKNLGPSDSRWLFVWSVSELSHKMGFDWLGPAPKGKIRIAAVLFDKATGTISWRDEVTAEAGVSGVPLLALVAGGLIENDAIDKGFHTIMSSFPKKQRT